MYDPQDLLDAITATEVRRAAVDVYPEEPRGSGPWTNPYASEPRVATTPHLGAATVDAQPRIARRVAQTIRNFSHAGSLRDCVFRPRMVLGLTDIPEDATLLSVVHGTTRGARKAIQDAIFDAGASNLSTAHMDLDDFGVAIDLLALDRPLSESELYTIRERAEALTGTPGVVRSLRQI